MIKILDFSCWDIYEGASEGSGRSEKIWLESKQTNRTGLFKYPKSEFTTEYISEKLASDIGSALGIYCAEVDIGKRDGRIGCLSYQINTENIALIEGVNFITAKRPDFDPSELYDHRNKEYYSIGMILEILNSPKHHTEIIKMMLFDALIGNSDRHQSNWAYLFYFEHKELRFCPLYDNGSSLCAYVRSDQVEEYLRDRTRFNSLVDSKSRSRIRINSKVKREPSHKEVLTYIKEDHNLYNKEIQNFIDIIINTLTPERIWNILSEYDIILPKNKKTLIRNFLISKIELIRSVFSIY